MPDFAVEDVEIRALAKGDSIEELTRLLNRAYRPLAEMGLKYLATHQDSAMTSKRIRHGTCLVAVLDYQMVGTILYEPPHIKGETAWFDQPTVAKISQMGVEPECQRRGIASRLMIEAENLARVDCAQELALDTAETAYHLIKWYERLGYRFIEYCNWEITNYRSVIMSKSISR